MGGASCMAHSVEDYELHDTVLALCGVPPLEYFFRVPNADIDAPYFLKPFTSYTRSIVYIVNLRSPIASNDGNGMLQLMPVVETPHFKYLCGDTELYGSYIDRNLGNKINED